MTGTHDRRAGEALVAEESAGTALFGSARLEDADSSAGLRRRSVDPTELYAVGAIACVGGLVAAIWMGAEPTNTAFIDAVERGLAVIALGFAGSRSRRWALVVGAAVVTAASPWPALLLGLVALGATVFLVETRARSRVVGSVIGALVALGSMSLEVPGQTGIETLLALAATVPILISGYRRSSETVRKRVRRGLMVLVVLLIVLLVLTGIAAAMSASDVSDAITLTDSAVDAASGGEGGESAALFASANASFRSADESIGSWWASGPRVIPIVGANLAAVQRAVGAGVELSAAGEDLVSGAEFSQVQLDDGGVDLVALGGLSPRVVAAHTALAEANERLSGAESVWLLEPLADRLGEVQERLVETSTNADNAAVAVDGLPSLLGAEAPRRYLFLFGNPAEARDMGGHIGNWAEVVADNGRIDLIEVGGPLELASPELSDGFRDTLPASFATMDPARNPQNLGATPDLPVAMEAAAEIFEARTGRTVDGVAYADVETFAAMLGLSGPVEVPGLDGFELSEDNAVEFLTRDQYVLFDSTDASGEALESVISTVFDRLTNTKLPGPDQLGATFSPLVGSGRFQLSSRHGDDHGMLEYFGLDGSVSQPAGHDVLGVFNRNAGPSKIDSFLERDVSAVIRWDAETGAVGSKVWVTLHNDAPAGGINDTIGGSRSLAEPGANVTDLVVLSPFELVEATVDGVPQSAQSVREGELWRHTVRIAVDPGSTVDATFRLSGEVEPGSDYTLDWVGQPLLNNRDFTVDISPVVGKVVEMRAGDEAGTGSRIESPQDRDASIRWSLEGV